MPGNIVTKSPMFITMERSRKVVLPVNSAQPARTTASATFSCERLRMPLSTPVVAEMVARTTARTTRAVWAPRPWGIPKRMFNPTLSITTPIPSDVATPKIVPITVAMSTECPMSPRTRLPKRGASTERTASGAFLRWAKYPRASPMRAYIPQPVIP